METSISLTYSSSQVTYQNSAYTIYATDVVGPDGLHMFLQDSDNLMAVYLKVGYTSINGTQPASVEDIIAALGNPPDLTTFGANLIS
jgi:hypothetical protein